MKRFIGYHFFQGAGRIAATDAYYRTQQTMSLYTDQKTPSRRSFMLDLAKLTTPKEAHSNRSFMNYA